MDVYIHTKNMIQGPWTYIYVLTNAFYYFPGRLQIFTVVSEKSWLFPFLNFYTQMTRLNMTRKICFGKDVTYVHDHWGSYFRKGSQPIHTMPTTSCHCDIQDAQTLFPTTSFGPFNDSIHPHKHADLSAWLHWNVWCHQMSFETFLMLSIRTPSFLFFC